MCYITNLLWIVLFGKLLTTSNTSDLNHRITLGDTDDVILDHNFKYNKYPDISSKNSTLNIQYKSFPMDHVHNTLMNQIVIFSVSNLIILSAITCIGYKYVFHRTYNGFELEDEYKEEV